MTKNIRIKIIAIAKDEGAYLPEWVHHHLYLGFDAIEVYVNRTTDNSHDVLKKISDEYPNVSFENVDWVDICPENAKKNIQFISYSYALNKTREEGGFTHVLFLDVDEFLIINNFECKISDFISKFDNDESIYLEWLNDCPEEALPFTELQSEFKGNISPLGKTIYPIDTKFIELRHHLSRLYNEKVKLSDNTEFSPHAKIVQAVNPVLSSLKNVFIYHRANRSQKEYVSLLYRGRPGDSFPFKSNRNGYPEVNKSTHLVSFDNHLFSDYKHSFEKFKEKTEFHALHSSSLAFVNDRYEDAISNIEESLYVDFELMSRLFSGVRIDRVVEIVKSYRHKLVNFNKKNVDELVKLALVVDKYDRKEALKILKVAQRKRPNGPLINKKIQEIESHLKNKV
ncbi:glycosyltransferase family 2 protein [Vibrio astriarenae]